MSRSTRVHVLGCRDETIGCLEHACAGGPAGHDLLVDRWAFAVGRGEDDLEAEIGVFPRSGPNRWLTGPVGREGYPRSYVSLGDWRLT